MVDLGYWFLALSKNRFLEFLDVLRPLGRSIHYPHVKISMGTRDLEYSTGLKNSILQKYVFSVVKWRFGIVSATLGGYSCSKPQKQCKFTAKTHFLCSFSRELPNILAIHVERTTSNRNSKFQIVSRNEYISLPSRKLYFYVDPKGSAKKIPKKTSWFFTCFHVHFMYFNIQTKIFFGEQKFSWGERDSTHGSTV